MEMKLKYLSEKQVAALTGYSLLTLRNWRFQGKGIPYCKIGTRVRYRLEDVHSFMESNIVYPDIKLVTRTRYPE